MSRRQLGLGRVWSESTKATSRYLDMMLGSWEILVTRLDKRIVMGATIKPNSKANTMIVFSKITFVIVPEPVHG